MFLLQHSARSAQPSAGPLGSANRISWSCEHLQLTSQTPEIDGNFILSAWFDVRSRVTDRTSGIFAVQEKN